MPKFVAPIKAKDKAMPGQDQDSKKIFEDDLEDDFLTSWKPTLPSMTLDMDDQVRPPKSFVKKAFASSSTTMDFDFDEGFNKLASFDIDLSFDDPPSRAKKAKKIEPPKKLVSDKDDIDNDFFKGFDTLDLEETSFKPISTMKVGPENKSSHSKAGDLPTRMCDSRDSEHLEPDEDTDTEEKSIKSRQDIKLKTRDVDEIVQRSSPSFQLDFLTDHSAEGKSFEDCYKATLPPDREAVKVSATTNPPPDIHDASEPIARHASIPVSNTGQETNGESTEKTNPAVFGDDGNFEDQSPRKFCNFVSDASGKSPSNEVTEDLDAKQTVTNNITHNEVQSLRTEQSFNPLPPVPMSLSPTVIRPDNQKSSSRKDPIGDRSLQFDPLSSKSKADMQGQEQLCSQPKNSSNLKGTNREVRFESCLSETETRDEEIVPSSLDDWAKSSSQPTSARDEENAELQHVQMSSKPSLSVSSENPENEPEQRNSRKNLNVEASYRLIGPDEKRNEARSESEMSEGTGALMPHRAALGENTTDSNFPNKVSLQDKDIVPGERTTLKKNDWKELVEPASGLIAANRLGKKRNNIIPSQDQVKLDHDVSKTPLGLPLGSKNNGQPGLPKSSSLPKEKQGESVEDERGSAKKFGQQLGDISKEKSTRAIAPAEEKIQKPQTQISSIQNLRHQNQLSSRPSQTSKTLLKSSPRSSVKISPHVQNAVLAKSSSLLSSITPQKRKPTQLISSIGSKAPATAPLEVTVTKSKGLRDQVQTSGASKVVPGSGSSRNLKERKLTAIENKGDTRGTPTSRTSLQTDRENLTQRKPPNEALKLKPEDVKQREVLPERSFICGKDRLKEVLKENGPKAVENKTELNGNPPPCSYLQSPLNRSTQRKPLSEEVELKDENVTQQPGEFSPHREHYQTNLAPRGDIVQKQIVPASDGTGVMVSLAKSPVDFLISESNSIMEQSIRHTEALEAMLKAMKKLNGNSKDLMVRALVANNKLLMLNSPILDDKEMKKSVMETLKRHCAY